MGESPTTMPVTDIHTHFFPESWPDLAARFGTPDWPWIKHTEPGKAVIMLGDREFRCINSACWDVNVRLEEMDRDGIDLQIISATPVLFAYGREPRHALECARIFNDVALEMCRRGKGRLKALCQVPLQDMDASCAELTRCMRAGHVGVADRQSCRRKESRRCRHRDFSASLRRRRRGRAGPSVGHDGLAAYAELHDAVDRGNARRDATCRWCR